MTGRCPAASPPFRKLLALLLIIGAPLGSVFAQQSRRDFALLENAALDELRESNTPGAAVAVVSGNRIVYVKGLGVSNVETGTPVAPEMLFRIGSVTKMFTAALLASLAEDGKLKLDEPIGKYVRGLSPKLSQVTSHQLLSGTAGLIDGEPLYGPQDESGLATGKHGTYQEMKTAGKALLLILVVGVTHFSVSLSLSPPIITSKSPGSATGSLSLPMNERSSRRSLKSNVRL